MYSSSLSFILNGNKAIKILQNTRGIWHKHGSLIYHVIFYDTGKLHNLPVLHFGTDATFETNVISDVRQLGGESRDFVALDYIVEKLPVCITPNAMRSEVKAECSWIS